MDCSPPGSSLHRILQARILVWVAIPFSRGFSWPRDQILVSRIAVRFFTIWATSWHFKMMTFFIFAQLMRHLLTELLHLSSLLQMPNNYRMVDFEFFGNFLCSCKRIEDQLQWSSQLVIVNFQRLAPALFIFKPLISFGKLLEPPLYCLFISSSWAKCIADVASCLCCFYDPFWTWIRKSLKFAFCLNISLV